MDSLSTSGNALSHRAVVEALKDVGAPCEMLSQGLFQAHHLGSHLSPAVGDGLANDVMLLPTHIHQLATPVPDFWDF